MARSCRPVAASGGGLVMSQSRFEKGVDVCLVRSQRRKFDPQSGRHAGHCAAPVGQQRFIGHERPALPACGAFGVQMVGDVVAQAVLDG
jgi:hypothetical protein